MNTWAESDTNSDFFKFYISGLGSGPLDVRIKRLAEERDDLQDNVRRLKMDLDEEKNRSQVSLIITIFQKTLWKNSILLQKFRSIYCEKKLSKLRYCENATKFEKKIFLFL